MITWIFQGILAAFATLAPKLLLMFGVGAASYAIVKPLFVKVQTYALSMISASSSQFAQAFEVMGVNDFVSIIFTAYMMSLGIKAAKGAAASR